MKTDLKTDDVYEVIRNVPDVPVAKRTAPGKSVEMVYDPKRKVLKVSGKDLNTRTFDSTDHDQVVEAVALFNATALGIR